LNTEIVEYTFADPATCPPEQLPGMLVRLLALQAVIATRLSAEPATVPAPTDDGLLTADDVAKLLKIPRSGVYEAARRQTLGSVRVSAGSRGGRSVRFTRAAVDAFIKARSRAAR